MCRDRDGSEEKATLSYRKTMSVLLKIAETQEEPEWGSDWINKWVIIGYALVLTLKLTKPCGTVLPEEIQPFNEGLGAIPLTFLLKI